MEQTWDVFWFAFLDVLRSEGHSERRARTSSEALHSTLRLERIERIHADPAPENQPDRKKCRDCSASPMECLGTTIEHLNLGRRWK